MSNVTYTTTLLCGEINPEKEDLATILNGESSESDESIAENVLKLIDKKLIVESWDEFLNTFQPTLYEVPMSDPETKKFTVIYEEKSPHPSAQPITFTRSHPLVQSFIQLMEQRQLDGQTNAYFEFSKALRAFSPERFREQAEGLRKEMLYLSAKYEELEEESPQRDQVGEKLANKLDQASLFFNNKTALLQLAQATVGEQLLQLAAPENETNAPSKLSLQPATFMITEEGYKAEPIQISEDGSVSGQSENDKGVKLLSGFVEEYYDSIVMEETSEQDDERIDLVYDEKTDQFITPSKDEKQKSYQKELVLQSFTGVTHTKITSAQLPQKIDQYNQYVEATASVMENYFNAISKIFSTLIGVKLFFDEYELHAKPKKVAPRLLIANTKLENLLAGSLFKKYVETIQNKGLVMDHGLLSVIVPGVELMTNNQVKSKANPMNRLKNKNKSSKETGVSLNDVKRLAVLLEPYRIPVFFGFNSKYSTYLEFQKSGFSEYFKPCLEQLRSRDAFSDLLVPCYPNMTIIPEDSAMKTAKKVRQEENVVVEDGDKKVYLKGLCIDASYIAASLVAAHQCSSYLQGKYPENRTNVAEGYPGVRLTYSEQGTKTLLPIEVKSMPTSLVEKINNLSVGFVFKSENHPSSNRKITVHSCHTCKTLENGQTRPLYRTLVEKYVHTELLYSAKSDKKDEYLKQLNEQSRSSLKYKWTNELSNKFNELFKENEDVEFEVSGTKGELKFTFSNEEPTIEISIAQE